MSSRVLVPYDRSDEAGYALEHAMEAFDGEIVLLHVVEPFADHTGAAGFEESTYEKQLELANDTLEGVREWFDERERDRISTVVRYGRPVHEILGYIDDERIDEVVIGSTGRDGANRLLLGSVAETVVRRAPVPVTVVRKRAEEVDAVESVLVPFDGSAHAREALEYALETFESATVTALYVAYPDLEAGDSETIDDWESEVDDHVGTVLGNAEELAASYDRELTLAQANDDPADGIVAYADDHGVDHVVVGSAGRDGIARLLLGSVAETVVRRSPVSTTVAN